MHEITVSGFNVTEPVRFGMAKLTMESARARGLEKVHVSHVGLHRLHDGFPLGQILALLLQVTVEDLACVPTWTVAPTLLDSDPIDPRDLAEASRARVAERPLVRLVLLGL